MMWERNNQRQALIQKVQELRRFYPGQRNLILSILQISSDIDTN